MSKKRGNGEGSRPRKRPDGRWAARYTIHTPKGSQRKTVYGRTRQEVADKLARALSDRAQGLTFERYEQIVRVHIKPVLGRVKLKDLTATHARVLYREVP